MQQPVTRSFIAAALAILLIVSGECADEQPSGTPQPNARSNGVISSTAVSRCTVSIPGSLREPAFPAPDRIASSVESITVSAYCHPLAPIAKNVPAFEIPARYHERLLAYFRRAELDLYMSEEDNEIGTAHILFKGGTNIRICWFYTGHKSRMSFSCRGVRYVTAGKKFANDEPLAVDGFIRRICKELTDANLNGEPKREPKRDRSN